MMDGLIDRLMDQTFHLIKLLRTEQRNAGDHQSEF